MSHHHHEPSWYSFERNSRLPRYSFDPPRRSLAHTMFITIVTAGALLALAIVSLL